MSDQPPTGAPTSTEEIAAQLAEELGVDPAALAAGGDPYGIFLGGGLTGSEQVVSGLSLQHPDRVHIPSNLTGREREQWYLQHRDDPDRGLTYSTSGDLLRDFYKMSTNTLRRTQALLFAGGFYGDVDVDAVQWGLPDEASFSAWAQLIGRTARLNAAGEKVTYTKVLSQAALAAGLDYDELYEALESGDDDLEALLGRITGDDDGRVINLVLSDPNGLRSTMDRAASAVLGRKANAAEQRMFISMIHNLQRQGQIAQQTAEPGTVSVGADPAAALGLGDDLLRSGDVVTQYAPPDEAATAEALARSENPAEAGAHDIALQFASFLEMLPAPVNVPRLTL